MILKEIDHVRSKLKIDVSKRRISDVGLSTHHMIIKSPTKISSSFTLPQLVNWLELDWMISFLLVRDLFSSSMSEGSKSCDLVIKARDYPNLSYISIQPLEKIKDKKEKEKNK